MESLLQEFLKTYRPLSLDAGTRESWKSWTLPSNGARVIASGDRWRHIPRSSPDWSLDGGRSSGGIGWCHLDDVCSSRSRTVPTGGQPRLPWREQRVSAFMIWNHREIGSTWTDSRGFTGKHRGELRCPQGQKDD
jgi:hypothetical protein